MFNGYGVFGEGYDLFAMEAFLLGKWLLIWLYHGWYSWYLKVDTVDIWRLIQLISEGWYNWYLKVDTVDIWRLIQLISEGWYSWYLKVDTVDIWRLIQFISEGSYSNLIHFLSNLVIVRPSWPSDSVFNLEYQPSIFNLQPSTFSDLLGHSFRYWVSRSNYGAVPDLLR